MRYDKTLKKLQESWKKIQEQPEEGSEKEEFLKTPGNVFRVTDMKDANFSIAPNSYFVVTNQYSYSDNYKSPTIMMFRIGNDAHNEGTALYGVHGRSGDYMGVEIEEVGENEIEQITNEKLKDYIRNASNKYRKSDTNKVGPPSPESVYPPDHGPGQKRYHSD